MSHPKSRAGKLDILALLLLPQEDEDGNISPPLFELTKEEIFELLNIEGE